ncbi:MbtH family protein [Rhizobium sp. YTU87027]|uniref:MbtH family protein n=1 Tax=Rhizobium sp. YTU87027 TaxID=3417741 RepID=UPI003D68138E
MENLKPDGDPWIVVFDAERRYSVWPQDRPVPLGWIEAGFSGSRLECLQHIGTVWTDPRPLSLRLAMDSDQRLQ